MSSASSTFGEVVEFLHASQECLLRSKTQQVLDHTLSVLQLKNATEPGANLKQTLSSDKNASAISTANDTSGRKSDTASSEQVVVFEAARIVCMLQNKQVQLQLHNPTHLLYTDKKLLTEGGLVGRVATADLEHVFPLERAVFLPSKPSTQVHAHSVKSSSQKVGGEEHNSYVHHAAESDRVEVDRLVVVPLFGQEWGDQIKRQDSSVGQFFVLARMFSIHHVNGVVEISVTVPVFDRFIGLESEEPLLQAAKYFIPFDLKLQTLSSSAGAHHNHNKSLLSSLDSIPVTGITDGNFMTKSLEYGSYAVKYPYFFPIVVEKSSSLEVKDLDLFHNSSGIRSVAHVLHYSESVERLFGLEVRLEECSERFAASKVVLLSLMRHLADLTDAKATDFKAELSRINGGDINSSISTENNRVSNEVEISNQIISRFRGITRFAQLTVERYRMYNSANIIRSDSNRAMLDANKQLASRICEVIKVMIYDVCELQQRFSLLIPPAIAIRTPIVAFASFIDCANMYRACLNIQSTLHMTLSKDHSVVDITNTIEARTKDFCNVLGDSFENRLSVSFMVDIEKQAWDSSSFYRRDCYVTTGLLAASMLLRKHLFYVALHLNLNASTGVGSETDIEVVSEHRWRVAEARCRLSLVMVQAYLQKLFEAYSALEVSRIRQSQFVIDILHIITTVIISVDSVVKDYESCLSGSTSSSSSTSSPSSLPPLSDEWGGLNTLLLHVIVLLFLRSVTNTDLLVRELSAAIDPERNGRDGETSGADDSKGLPTARLSSVDDYKSIRSIICFDNYFKEYLDKCHAKAKTDFISMADSVNIAAQAGIFYDSLADHHILGGKTLLTLDSLSDTSSNSSSDGGKDSNSNPGAHVNSRTESSLIDLFKKFPTYWTNRLMNTKKAALMFILLLALDRSDEAAIKKYFVCQLKQRPEYIGVTHYKKGTSRSKLFNKNKNKRVLTKKQSEYIPEETFVEDKYDFPKPDATAIEAREWLDELVVFFSPIDEGDEVDTQGDEASEQSDDGNDLLDYLNAT